MSKPKDPILVLTDSLGLPRASPERCKFFETWPELLRRKRYTLRKCSIGAATSEDILGQLRYREEMPIRACVIQVGIVDCTPRFASKLEVNMIKSMGKYISSALFYILNRPFVRKIRKKNMWA